MDRQRGRKTIERKCQTNYQKILKIVVCFLETVTASQRKGITCIS